MKPEAQRIAIAKACGLHVVSDGITNHLTPCGLKTEHDPLGCFLKEVPDYTKDTNAMHEAEKVLTESQRLHYVREVVLTCEPYLRNVIFGLDAARGWWLAHATAAQRAEAFLKTLNLWTK